MFDLNAIENRGYVTRRAEGIAWLTRSGEDAHLACFSRYGSRTDECAPVAWRLAYLIQRDTEGGPVDLNILKHAMSMVVNEHDDVAYVIREYGGGWYGR